MKWKIERHGGVKFHCVYVGKYTLTVWEEQPLQQRLFKNVNGPNVWQAMILSDHTDKRLHASYENDIKERFDTKEKAQEAGMKVLRSLVAKEYQGYKKFLGEK
jgi:hypothetical protein